MEDKFIQILNKLDPEKKILTEETRKELVSMLDDRIKLIKEEALTKAVDMANQKVSALEQEHAKKVAELTAQSKQKFSEDLAKMDVDHGKMLQEIVDKLDETHTEAFKAFVEKMDTDYADKFEKALIAMDADHNKKLLEVESALTKKNITEKLAGMVDGYLDEYLKEVMPDVKLADTAKLNRLQKFYECIKEMVFVDSDYVQTEVREAIMDAKSKIDEQKKIVADKDAEIDKLMFEKIELKKQIEKNEAVKLLAEKTKDMTPDLKAYVETSFATATSKEIMEKLDEAVKAFKKKEEDKRQEIVKQSDSKSKVKNPVILEDTTQKDLKKDAESDDFTSYVKILSKNKKK